MGRRWTHEEILELQEYWGKYPLPVIAKKMDRTVSALCTRAYKAGLGSMREAGERITYNELLKALGLQNSYTSIRKKLLQQGFPFHIQRINTGSCIMVSIDAFWRWMEEHQDALDFTRFEEYMLGREPEWAKNKRKRDREQARSHQRGPWQNDDDIRLVSLLRTGTYSISELAQTLRRSEQGIRRRIGVLCLEQRAISRNGKRCLQLAPPAPPAIKRAA